MKQRKKHRYTREQKEYLRDICGDKSLREVHKMFLEKFGVSVTERSIRSVVNRNGWKFGRQGYADTFRNGRTAWNKGLNGLDLSRGKGQFKKGELSPKYKAIGSQTIRKGVVWIKVGDPDVWIPKHLHVWRKIYGPIPEGHVIRFKDGNKMNVEKENLFMTPHRVCVSVARRNIESEHPELNVSVHRLAELELAIKDME